MEIGVDEILRGTINGENNESSKYDKSLISPYRREWLVESHLIGCFYLFPSNFGKGVSTYE